MTIPKNKRRTVHINEVEYEWCATNPGITDKGEKKIDIYIKNTETSAEINISGAIFNNIKPYNVVQIIGILGL